MTNKQPLPRMLRWNGRAINYAGRGRAPGSHLYVDAACGATHEVFLAQVAQVGPIFSLVSVAGNPALPSVRVDNAAFNGSGPPRLGTTLLVGPLAFRPAGPRADAAWPIQDSTHANRPNRTIKLGFISCVKGPDWGFIRPLDGGVDAFVHANQLRRGATLTPGLRVRYEQTVTERGMAAINVFGD